MPFLEYCWLYAIVPFCLPAYLSHRLQPLDIGLFSPLAHFYALEIENMLAEGVYGIEKRHFLEAYPKARAQAFRASNIAKVWRESGIQPFDPQRVVAKLKPHNIEPLPDSMGARLSAHRFNVRSSNDIEGMVNHLGSQALTPRSQRCVVALIKGAKRSMTSAILQEHVELGRANLGEKKGIARRLFDTTDGGHIIRDFAAAAQAKKDQKEADKDRERRRLCP